MNDSLLQIFLLVCAASIVYSYVLYAPMIWLLSKLFGRPSARAELRDDRLPSVSVLIAAHNEQDVIEARILNALASDYPRELVEIVVASDGSTDATAAIVARFADRGVKLIDSDARRGKSRVLNETVASLRGEIVLFSDANTHTDPAAVRKLVRWFVNNSTGDDSTGGHPAGDASIGVVCGRLVLTDPATGRNVDSLYWKYETFLKRCESRLGALLGSNGAIYAMRRALYQRIPDDTLVDDFVIPLLAKQRTGCRIVYDGDAIAREETPRDLSSEFHRRSRIGAGGFQSITILWKLLNPRRGWVALTFFSHKILRWVCPFFMIGLVISNLLLLDRPVYRALAIAQVAFYAISAIAGWLPTSFRALRPLRLTTMFTAMNAALFVGFFRWLFVGGSGAWRRTQR
ncbi:glycosyltransferase family 2 protein [soil metagenome]